jgi:type II secretory pathway pseudopilin PulG
MTLVELLMVMVLMGLLLGGAVGLLANIDLGRRAATGMVQNVIRSARNSAQARGAPARVRFDPVGGTIVAEAMEIVGTWHFEEDSLPGAFGHNGINSGGVLVEDGWIGRALSFAGRGAASAEFPVQSDPSFEFSQGFALECAVRIEDTGGGQLVKLGGSIGLDVTGQLGVRGWFLPLVTDTAGVERAGGKVYADTPPASLRPGRWHRVRYEYDRRTARLLIDGVELGRAELEAAVWTTDGPLLVGDAQRGFPGSLDNLVVGAVAASDVIEMPETVRFAADVPPVVRFDAGGHLDREVHPGPIEFHLEFEDGDRIPLRIGMYGTVEG